MAVFLAASLLFSIQSFAQVCAVPGANGPANLSGVVNTYYPPLSSGTVNSASSAIGLGTSTGAVSTAAPGDLFMIIQMQCANINTTNTNNYGAGNGTASGSTDPASSCLAGNYEYIKAGPATTNTSLDLTGSPLVNTYVQDNLATTNRRTYQLIRIPQHSSATLTGNLFPNYWNGSSGGVLVLDVAGSLNMAGFTIDAAGRGFRGAGAAGNWDGTADSAITFVTATDTTQNLAAFKGEGIVGTPAYVADPSAAIGTSSIATGTDYTGGGQGKGAPGNAGGGGDNYAGDRDNGGGGGSNAGIGGFGGYGYAGAGWPAGQAQDLRGIGGAQFTGASTSRLIMGGGGGGANNNSNINLSNGGAGGGIVMVRAGTITGTGTINVNGGLGANNVNNDAGGGGGAGGTVLVNTASNSVGTLTITATGGKGGDSYVPGAVAHAGGGGGSGGQVYSDGTPSVSSAGGANGITNVETGADAANGATSGGVGISGAVGADPTGNEAGAFCIPQLTVTKSTSTPAREFAIDGIATYSIVISNAAGKGSAIGVNAVDVLPAPFTYVSAAPPTGAAAPTVAYSGGATGPGSPITTITSGTSTVTFGTAAGTSANSFTLPGGASVTITSQLI